MKNSYMIASETTPYGSDFSMNNSECNYAFPIEKSSQKHKLKKKELKKLLKLMRKEGLVFADGKKKKKARKKKKMHKKQSYNAFNEILVSCLPKIINVYGECAIEKIKASKK